jgi:hypothetical protein
MHAKLGTYLIVRCFEVNEHFPDENTPAPANRIVINFTHSVKSRLYQSSQQIKGTVA